MSYLTFAVLSVSGDYIEIGEINRKDMFYLNFFFQVFGNVGYYD